MLRWPRTESAIVMVKLRTMWPVLLPKEQTFSMIAGRLTNIQARNLAARFTRAGAKGHQANCGRCPYFHVMIEQRLS